MVRCSPRVDPSAQKRQARRSRETMVGQDRRTGMGDATSTLDELKSVVRTFVEERAWQPFHSPKNLAMGIAVEAAELMECFLWLDLPASYETVKDEDKREAIADEMADVFCYLLNM